MFTYQSDLSVPVQPVRVEDGGDGRFWTSPWTRDAQKIPIFDRTRCGVHSDLAEATEDLAPTELTYEELINAGWEQVHELA